MTEKNKQLSRFGFSFERGGAHTSRTMMLEELGALLTYVDRPEAEKSEDPELLIDERHILDLSELLRQYAVMEAVQLALCRPECKGLCLICGQNLNLGSCGCTDRAVDPRLAELAKLLHREPDEDQQRADPEKG